MPTQIGNMAAVATPETASVGIVTYHTLTPLIVNDYGSYGIKDKEKINGWSTLGVSESLVPLINEMNSDRATLAVTHCRQVTPISNAEPPLVITGAEMIIPQITSSRFVQKAKKDGVVVRVNKNETLHVLYNNGETEVFDITPRKSQTKRGAYILLEMQTLSEGTKFKKNQIVAATKNFDLKTNMYTSGKNLNIAVMNYLGYSHEDAYCISKRISESTTTDTISELYIIIPPETKVFQLETKIGKETKMNDVLVEFSYEEDIENYLMTYGIDLDNEDSENIIGNESDSVLLKSPGGRIADIRVEINDRNKSDAQLIKLHKELVNRIINIKNDLQLGKVTKSEKNAATDNLETKFFKIGGHKLKGQEFRGIKVTYSIITPKKTRVGDKIANRYGAKGLIGYIYDRVAKAEKSGDIDVFISPISVFGRKNLAAIKELYLGKLTWALNRKVKQMAENDGIKVESIIKLVNDYYKLVCSKNTQKSINDTLTSMTTASLRKSILNDVLKFQTIIEPFFNITFENIKTAAALLKIELDEKVTIEDEDGKMITTDVKVPVGKQYFQFLEHYSSVYASVGGAVKYSGISKQPVKVGSGANVSSMGQLDINALVTYNVGGILQELLGARSDHHKSKRDLYTYIAENGEGPETVENDPQGGTSEIKDIYLTALGLITR